MYFGYKILKFARPKSTTDFGKGAQRGNVFTGSLTPAKQSSGFCPQHQEGYPVTGTHMGPLPAGVSGLMLIFFWWPLPAADLLGAARERGQPFAAGSWGKSLTCEGLPEA